MQITGGKVGSLSDWITVGLQDMYSYTLWIIIILIILAFVPPLIWIITFINKKRKNIIADENEPVKIVDIKEARQKYIALLQDIKDKYNQGKLSKRHAYQQLSRAIRHFVYDVTGIKVQNYTLSEIKQLNIPRLYYLIDECYEPEFSKQGDGEITETIDKAGRIITEWN